ncbi:TPA: SdrD B-like domain-containing protein, partial [Streptococcus pneumoniae]
VEVTLLDGEGNPIPEKTTQTDANGYYQFDMLPAGEYQVRFKLPEGFVFVKPLAGGNVALDSDATPVSGPNDIVGVTKKIVLNDENTHLTPREGVQASQGIDPTWDAGVRRAQVSVGDKVWFDTTGAGIQDGNETGIPGVTLVLKRSDNAEVLNVAGELVAPVVTDEDGNYLFEGLPLLPKGVKYVVTLDAERSRDALAEFKPTLPGVGDDRSKDSSTGSAEALELVE